MTRYLYITLAFLFTTLVASANDSSYVKFTFADPLPTSKFFIVVHDGINEIHIDPQTTPYWHGELFSSFGLVELGYKISDTSSVVKKAFFNKGNCEVHLSPTTIENNYFAIDEKASKNLASYQALGGTAFDSFTKAQKDTAYAFLMKHRTEIGRDAEITRQGEALFLSFAQRQAAFIRQFPDYYVSFFTLAHLSRLMSSKPDTLMELYDAVLPDALKRSRAAEYLHQVLSNKVAVNSLGNFPGFSVHDINGNKIESSALRGKHVLIQFWASWCSPCVAEIPAIKWINDTYSGSNLAVISFNVDKDSSAFHKVVEKYAMTWTQIFGDRSLRDSLGSPAVPQVFLVDPNGRTIYNRDSMNDPDLVRLKEIMQERIGHSSRNNANQ